MKARPLASARPVALLGLAVSLIWWRGPDWHARQRRLRRGALALGGRSRSG